MTQPWLRLRSLLMLFVFFAAVGFILPASSAYDEHSSLAARGGVPVTANFAQTSFREAFSKAGAAELSKITGMPIQTIDDLAAALRSRSVSPSQIPVNTINRGGPTLILNTRTAQALERAGIPRSQWNGINQTGNPLFEQMLTDQLRRNQLSPAGTPLTFPE